MSDRLRIAMCCHPTFGGSGAVAMELASALVQRGHEVHVLSHSMPFRLSLDARINFHRVDVPAYPLFTYPPFAMALASKLAEVAVQHDLQILHAHYAIPHSMAAYLARKISGKKDLRIITTLHGTDITLVGGDPSYRSATAFALRRSDALTAVSQFLVEATRKAICSDCEIQVIPNFVDTERYVPREDPKQSLTFRHEGEVLLSHVSNFRPVKRVLDVVRIFALVQKSLPARLIMVGDGPDRPAAEDLCRELGLESRVLFLGLKLNTLPILQSSQAFLFPSAGEAFGLAALEALACGVPVVGARVGGLPEVLRDGQEGILREVGDVASMAQALVRMLQDSALQRRVGRQARERAVTCFRQESVVPLYEEAYRKLLQEN